MSQANNSAAKCIGEGITLIRGEPLVRELLMMGAILFGGYMREAVAGTDLATYLRDHDVDMMLDGNIDPIMKRLAEFGVTELKEGLPYKTGTKRVIFVTPNLTVDLTLVRDYEPILDFSPNVLTFHKNKLGTLGGVNTQQAVRAIQRRRMECLYTHTINAASQKKQFERLFKMYRLGYTLIRMNAVVYDLMRIYLPTSKLTDYEQSVVQSLMYLVHPIRELQF